MSKRIPWRVAGKWRDPGLLALLAGLAAWTALAWFLHRAHTGDILDDGLYFVSAQALSQGHGYTLPSQIGPPMRSRYPAGLPALVALALRIAPGEPSLARDVLVMRVVMIILAWVFLLAGYAWLRRMGAPRVWAVPAVLAMAFDPTVTMLSLAMMSDVPMAGVALVEATRWASPRARRAGWAARTLLGGVLCGIALSIRVVGVALFPPAMLAARRGGGRLWWITGPIAVITGAALVQVPLRMLVASGGGRLSGSYGNELLAGWTSLGAGLRMMLRHLGEMASYLPVVAQPLFLTQAIQSRPLLGWALWIAPAVFLVVGTGVLARRTRPRDWPAWAYVAITLAILLVWSGPFMHRFILSLYPMVLLALARGAEWFGNRLHPRLGRALGSLFLLACLGGGVAYMGSVAARAWTQGGYWGDPVLRDDMEATLAHIGQDLPADAGVVSMAPEMVYLHTGRQGALLLREIDKVKMDLGNPDLFLARLDEAPNRPYFLMGPVPESDTTPECKHIAALRDHPRMRLEEVYRSPRGRFLVARIVRR